MNEGLLGQIPPLGTFKPNTDNLKCVVWLLRIDNIFDILMNYQIGKPATRINYQLIRK